MTVTIVDAGGNPVDPNQAGGTVTPSSGSFRQFEVISITAQAKDGYRIKRWVGTADDTKKDATLTFTVNGPMNLQIEFELIPLYKLTTRVEGRVRIDGSTESCSITPDHKRGEYYRDGQVVTVTAVPVGSYIVDRWTGTDNDASWKIANTVTMTSDKEVTVSFTTPRTLEVPGQYPNIASAIKAARTHGDTIIVKRGTYSTHSMDFGGKAITLASDNPDDPCCVAETVIDCGNLGAHSSSRMAKAPIPSSTVSRSKTARLSTIPTRLRAAAAPAPTAPMRSAAPSPASKAAVRRSRTWSFAIAAPRARMARTPARLRPLRTLRRLRLIRACTGSVG